MLINGEKWACESCIKGHRVSGCQHSDRKLLHISPKGHPIRQQMSRHDATAKAIKGAEDRDAPSKSPPSPYFRIESTISDAEEEPLSGRSRISSSSKRSNDSGYISAPLSMGSTISNDSGYISARGKRASSAPRWQVRRPGKSVKPKMTDYTKDIGGFGATDGIEVERAEFSFEANTQPYVSQNSGQKEPHSIFGWAEFGIPAESLRILNKTFTYGSGPNDLDASRRNEIPQVTSSTTSHSSSPEEGSYDSDTESMIFSESLDSILERERLGLSLFSMKIDLVERLLSSFQFVQLQRQWGIANDQETSGQSGEASHEGGKRKSGPLVNNNLDGHRSKRPMNSLNMDGRQGNDGNDEWRTPSMAPEYCKGGGLLFACPYVKRYPHRYPRCYRHTLKDVSRVKYHLFRDKSHHLPIYCPTCSDTFKSEELRDDHIRAKNCEERPPKKWDGITSKQREQLKKRLPSSNTAEANWFTVYKILFPDDPLPNSPYIDMSLSDELRAFREHHLSEGPRIWRDILLEYLPESLRPYEDELLSFHTSAYAECVRRLYENWASRNPHLDAAQFQLSPDSGMGQSVDGRNNDEVPRASSVVDTESQGYQRQQNAAANEGISQSFTSSQLSVPGVSADPSHTFTLPISDSVHTEYFFPLNQYGNEMQLHAGGHWAWTTAATDSAGTMNPQLVFDSGEDTNLQGLPLPIQHDEVHFASSDQAQVCQAMEPHQFQEPTSPMMQMGPGW